MAANYPNKERDLLLDATKRALEELDSYSGNIAVKLILRTALFEVEPPPVVIHNPTEIGTFNELDLRQIANAINVEFATLSFWVLRGYPKEFCGEVTPFPPVQRVIGQLRLWNGPAIATWWRENHRAIKKHYKRKKNRKQQTCNS
jgi:hypothetical protein